MIQMEAQNPRIPSPPGALARLVEAASDADVTVSQLARLVSSDPSFSIQLLRLANSSIYRRGPQIASVERAVAILGHRSLRNLALCVAVRACVNPRELGLFDLNRFWEDSLRRAVASRMLAARVQGYDPTEAFTAGLLQDFGVLALVWGHAAHAERWMELVNDDPNARREREISMFGRSHDDVAQELAAAWMLPAEIAAVMQFHHRAEDAPETYRARCVVARGAERLAAVLSGDNKRMLLQAARDELHRSFRLTPAAVDGLLDQLGRKVEEVAAELGIRVGAQPTLESILQVANSGLVEINLSYEELVRELERAIAEKDALAQQLERRNRELEQLSITDSLTGLANRRALSGRLHYELKRVAAGGALAFIVADLDHFKRVNDTWGHDFGDLVLTSLAECLRGAVDETDMVARMGGEEFGIVAPDGFPTRVEELSTRILAAVRSMPFACPDGEVRHFTLSLGYAGVCGPCGSKISLDRLASRLYKTADAALYQAKQGGRDRSRGVIEPISWAEAARED